MEPLEHTVVSAVVMVGSRTVAVACTESLGRRSHYLRMLAVLATCVDG